MEHLHTLAFFFMYTDVILLFITVNSSMFPLSVWVYALAIRLRKVTGELVDRGPRRE